MNGLPENAPLRPLKWGRLLGVMLGGFILLLVGVFAWDEEIKPYPDLILEAVPEPDPALNGVRYLEKLWTTRPKLSRKDSDALSGMMVGRTAWDEDLFARCLAGWENALEELESALALPTWQVPERSAAEDRNSDYKVAVLGLRQLNLMACVALHHGQPDRTLAIQNALERWSARHAAGNTNALYQGLPTLIRSASANRLCDWLAAGKATAADLESFAQQWKDDRPSPDNFRTMCLRDAALVRDGLESIQQGPWIDDLKPPGKKPPTGRLFFKHGKTLNRYHDTLRWFIEHAADPAPSFEASALSRFADPYDYSVLSRWLDANAYGVDLLAWTQCDYPDAANIGILYPHFICRAMRVRIALERWKLAHSGSYPDDLKALVPEFLPAVPADPWNGQPLAGDFGTGIIYSAGFDWVRDLPTFQDSQGKPLRQWFADGFGSPGLRVTRPNPLF